jgi:hypothetical protein
MIYTARQELAEDRERKYGQHQPRQAAFWAGKLLGKDD